MTVSSYYNILVGKPEGKEPLVRPRRKWKVNIKKDLREVGGKVWIGCIWLRIGYINLKLYPLFCIGVKIGVSH
jgi:hypothetical protein